MSSQFYQENDQNIQETENFKAENIGQNDSENTSAQTQSSVSTTQTTQVSTTKSNKTLEEKLTRLQQIQQLLSQKTVPLSQSMSLLEEAYLLKKEIEQELKAMETHLISLTKSNVDENQN